MDEHIGYYAFFTPLEELETQHTSSMNRAGMDDLTPVDTFLRANGDYVYITQEEED